jgi:hypothetical protein
MDTVPECLKDSIPLSSLPRWGQDSFDPSKTASSNDVPSDPLPEPTSSSKRVSKFPFAPEINQVPAAIKSHRTLFYYFF